MMLTFVLSKSYSLRTNNALLARKEVTMIKQYYSIYDSKAKVFHEYLTACHTPGEAERNFRELANDKNTSIGKHPEDFDLYQVGSFDTVSGKFAALDTPQHIVKAIQLTEAKLNAVQ